MFGFLVAIGSITEPVIANLVDIDQGGDATKVPTAIATSDWYLFLWGILAIFTSWIWVHFRFFKLSLNRIPDGNINGIGGVTGAFVLAFIMLLLATLGKGFAASGLDVQADPTLRTMCILMIGSIVGQLPVAVYFFVKSTNRNSFTMPSVTKMVGLGFFGLILTLPVVLFALNIGYIIQYWMTGNQDDGIAHGGLQLMLVSQDKAYLLPVLLMVILVTPLLEEILYRGLVQRGFRAMGFPPWVAIFAASLPFTMMHLGVVEPPALAGLFILSLGFGWVYERGGSIIAPFAFHASFNGVNAGYALLFSA